MVLTAATLLAVLASPAPGAGDRLLLCRPQVLGDPALARADALVAAARGFGQWFLDYGVPCDGAQEAARAARRAGLRHAISSSAEGRSAGSRFVLTLSEAEGERALDAREVSLAPGADAAAPLDTALRELLARAAPPQPRARAGHGPGPWILVGAGAAALAAGTAFAAAARSAARDADGADAPQKYLDSRNAWKTRRAASGVLLGAGGAAVAAGLAWRFAF